MRYSVNNKTLTIFLVGQLNSLNYEEIEGKIDQILESETFESIEIDMEELEYISSAGLRIIVKIKKQYDKTTLVNVTDDIYELLDMVGFTTMMEVKRK